MLPLTNQPVYHRLLGWREQHYPVAQWINNNGFYIGCHQDLTRHRPRIRRRIVRAATSAVRTADGARVSLGRCWPTAASETGALDLEALPPICSARSSRSTTNTATRGARRARTKAGCEICDAYGQDPLDVIAAAGDAVSSSGGRVVSRSTVNGMRGTSRGS